jgi:hypothetical protein
MQASSNYYNYRGYSSDIHGAKAAHYIKDKRLSFSRSTVGVITPGETKD